MANKLCIDCGAIGPKSPCTSCQSKRDRARDQQRGTTTERSYGTTHQQRRAALLPAAIGQACPLCGNVMTSDQPLHLDHTNPEDKLRGLPGDRITHSWCNESRGNKPSPPLPLEPDF